MTLATDVYVAYRQVLAEQVHRDPSAWTFKSNPAYRQILEHVTPWQGGEYLAQAQASLRWSARMRVLAAETALENDRFGQPVRAQFDVLGIYCSPTNMRYLWHAMEILDWVDQVSELKPVNIVEIGGGYGGLALWIHRLAPFFLSTIASYTILDVPEASAIQAKYAKELGLSLQVMGGLTEQPWFLISAYAFSEFSGEIRAEYEQTLIKHCEHGWLLWNLGPVYPFTEHMYEVADEVPLTGQGNKVVRF